MNLIELSQIWEKPRTDLYPVALRNGEVITFLQFRRDVERVASRLKNCQRAILACSDSYYFAVGIYALLHAEAVIVLPTNLKYTALEHYQCDLHIDDDFITLPSEGVVCLSRLNPSRPAFEFFTSGSTGQPKKISKTLQMLENEITLLNKMMGSQAGTGPVFATVPHHHLYALTFKLLWPLATGRMFSANMYTFWEMLLPEITSGSTIVSSPVHLGHMGGLEPLPATCRPSQVFSAGAVLPFTASLQSAVIFGCIPTEVFGSTETGAIAIRHQKIVNEPWKLLPDITIECDTESRLVLRSPCIEAGPFTTADKIELLPNGFHFLGRVDRIAKIQGKRISLIEVEKVLLQLSWVNSAAIVVSPGDYPQLVAALVLSSEGKTLLADIGKFRFSRQLRQALLLTLEPMAIPRLWRFVDSLPVSNLGKIRESDLLALFEETI